MRYLQIIEAADVHAARRAYVELLDRHGVELSPALSIYVETVHRPRQQAGSWLCYLAQSMQHAA